MSTNTDDICAEIRRKLEAADHFKNLWMQANEELERANQKNAQLVSAMNNDRAVAGHFVRNGIGLWFQVVKVLNPGPNTAVLYHSKEWPGKAEDKATEEAPESPALMVERLRNMNLGTCDQAANVIEQLIACQSPAISVDKMVDRFLGWKIPQSFSPDCGITFDGRKDDEWNKGKTWPTGTNVFNATEARAMFEYCLNGDKA